jgi:hypothetical protein
MGRLRVAVCNANTATLGLRFLQATAIAAWYVNLEEPLRRTPIGFDYMTNCSMWL